MKKGTKFKHLTWNDRLVIERMMKKKINKEIIAEAVGCSLRTVYNEIKRAQYQHLNDDWSVEYRYSPDIAQAKYEKGLRKKGCRPKLLYDKKLLQYISDMIICLEYSPEAILLYIKTNPNLQFDTEVKSVNTIYTAIKRGYIENVSMERLPRRGKINRCKKKIVVKKQARANAGKSIEKRPEEILLRERFGDWEMDCVHGKRNNKKTALVFTERKTRFEIIEKLNYCTTDEVRKALNRIEKRYGSSFYKVFKTITVDNGSEFADYESMEKALYRKGKRTEIYYCHPRAPQERGSNENANELIRRFLPKGSDFDKLINRNTVKDVEWWLNTYPRKILGGLSALDVFSSELETLGIAPPIF
ncbi:MAG: IS30 family transposase [Firmicutes bacterium]|nr:IS30 family transposase [Bacillota bacterium]